MASVSFLARSVARRSVDKLVRVNPQQVGVASSLLGSVRWSTSYFTPGKKRIANKQEPACLPARLPATQSFICSWDWIHSTLQGDQLGDERETIPT